jgi:hypothetical protein
MSTIPIVFRRKGGFYLTEYPADYSDWQAEANRNPGTIRIESIDGTTLWPVLTSVGVLASAGGPSAPRGDNISPSPLGDADNDDFATIPHLGPVA